MGSAGTTYARIRDICAVFLREDDANTTTEYTVMAAIIIVGLFAVLSPFSDRLDTIYGRIDAELTVASEGS